MATRERLNVLQICHDYKGPFRTVCRQYTHAFEDHRITTVYLRGARRDDIVGDTGGDRVIFLEQRPLKGIKLAPMLAVASLFREESFDVVIAHRYKPIYIAGVMSRFFPVKLLMGVVHEHGVFNRFTRSLLLTRWCRNINVVAVSDTVRRDISNKVPSLARDNRIFTLNNVIDTSQRNEYLPRDEARKALGIPEKTFCFGTIGRLVEKKDHDVLVEGF
ncbi:MAG: glycosyltransferase, partial [Pseudomonadales bacterium]|nr:glycosyltransferase [Pseudomonadales bacterium]